MVNVKEEMLDKKRWAVIGVTDNEERFGYKIWEILQEHDYEAYGVNPKLKELKGQKIYESVKDIPVDIDVLNMVVGPKVAIKTLEEAKEKGIEYIFFQPGSYNDKVIDKTKDMGFKYLDGDCIYATLKNKT